MYCVGVSMIYVYVKLKLIFVVRCEDNFVGKLYLLGKGLYFKSWLGRNLWFVLFDEIFYELKWMNGKLLDIYIM